MDLLMRLRIEKLNAGAYCGYKWQSEIGLEDIPSFNPASEQLISTVSGCTSDDYQHVIKCAENAFNIWRDTPAPKRGDIIRQIADSLREYKEQLGTLVSLEMGKSIQEGIGEVQEMIDIADFAVGQSLMLYGKTMHSERYQHRMYEQWHPYGIVGVITAFNFPVAVWAWNAFIAAICGNVTVWKPSTTTPLSAIAVHKICLDVLRQNNCPDIFSLIIPKLHDITNELLNDKRIGLISFTGSTATGKFVAETVAKRLGRTILELGGNNAVIVDKTADLNLAIPAIVFGALGCAGQRCTTTRRVFVEEAIFTDVLAKLVHAYTQVTVGSPLDDSNLMGPLINKDAVAKYEQVIKKAQELGGQVFQGGKLESNNKNFVKPAIIHGLDNDCELVQIETFAPILYVMPYKSLADVITKNNAVPQGLSSAIFTNDIKSAELFLSSKGSDCGLANVNIGTSGAEIGGAFGGEKETGGGRESGSDAWKGYMRRQTNTINWGSSLPLAQGIKFNL